MAAPTLVNVGAFSQGTAAITPALPLSLAVNDILLLFIQTENQAITIPTPAGGTWTEVTGSPQGTGTAGSGGDRLTVFWSRYNGTQTAPTTSSSGDHQKGFIAAYRGCITTGNPWDITAGSVAAAATTAVSVPGGTTTVGECCIVAAVSNTTDTGTTQFTTWTNASLVSITQRQGGNSITGLGGGLNVADGVKTVAGVVSASTATLATASLQGRLMIALKPASANVVATPGLGAPVLAGFAPLALLTIRIATGLGAPVFTGFAPTVVASNHQVITPGLSQPVFTGQSPSVAIGAATVIQPGTAALSFAGAAPTVLITVKLPVGLGQPVFTGLAPTVAVSNNIRITPGVGASVFTGIAPAVVASISASPGVGAVTFAGFSPSAVLSDNRLITTSLGQVTFAGLAPNVTTASSASLVKPGTGQWTFTGFAPNLIQPLRRAIARSTGITPIRTGSSGTTGIRQVRGTSIMDTYTTDNAVLTTDSTRKRTDNNPMGR